MKKKLSKVKSHGIQYETKTNTINMNKNIKEKQLFYTKNKQTVYIH